ncbi:hypothetical protein BC939DRAFT_501058 [Gamsiella multidivaricata]|uniref:uncharacterized protein n=1 Tax=Gamsiella multidivaricata TaxID=101098 RepID=UPI00221F2877|nr:uncharacterized protein BC939DRAFT_501058 [Gamsiella multidivaricata]KAG0368355.1 hypothetical protein BGZ54_002071 [Gamsiella multidivaricata]KAI7828086.1 hypothetical protein BC939DRAFT_501058 [Gamsiella multidivaricata]
MAANSNKRSTSGEWSNGGEGSSNSKKRVRFGGDRESFLEEFDDSDLLEQRKGRRGGVTVVEYMSGEESSDDENFNKKKKKAFVDDIPGAVTKASVEEEEEEDDMFADPEEIERRRIQKKKKAALRDKGKNKGFDRSEIEGEELNLDELDEEEYDSEGNPKIEAFNMKEELEEGGEIDEAGNFIRKLDPDRFHDSWLEGVSRKDIQSAREAHERKMKQAQAEEREAAATIMTETDIYMELVNILRPSETVIEALQRLGGGKKAGAKSTKNTKKKSWQKNKRMDEEGQEAVQAPESEEDIKRRKAIEKLTDLCDRMMAMGHFDIYEETYEQAVRILRRADVIPDDWVVGTPVLKPGEQTLAMLEDDPLLSNPVSWEYKWANPPEGQSADEIFGPFSGAEMKSWSDQGFFSQGILVRMVGDNTFEPGESVSFA